MATEIKEKQHPGATASPNRLGLMGLILSLLGIPTLGLLAPLGLIVSLFGLRRPPRGLAIAGAILGGLGTLSLVWLVPVILAILLWSRSPSAPPSLLTQERLIEAKERIEAYRAEHSTLPDEATGTKLIEPLVDGWDRALRYEPNADGKRFIVRSGGADGQFDTSDDATSAPGELLDIDELDVDIDLGTDSLPLIPEPEIPDGPAP